MTHQPFAKLFDTARGHVLAVLELEHEEGPSLTVFCDPGPPCGVSKTRFGFDDDDEGRKAAREALAKMTAAKALIAVGPIFELAEKCR